MKRHSLRLSGKDIDRLRAISAVEDILSPWEVSAIACQHYISIVADGHAPHRECSPRGFAELSLETLSDCAYLMVMKQTLVLMRKIVTMMPIGHKNNRVGFRFVMNEFDESVLSNYLDLSRKALDKFIYGL